MSNNFVLREGLEVAKGVVIQSGGLTVTNGDISLPDVLRIGAAAGANRFPNATVSISKITIPTKPNELHNIGLVSEGLSDPINTAINGVGVYGVGYTAGGTLASGVVGEGHVSDTSDSGSSIGVRGYAIDTHGSGSNIGLFGTAANGLTNYALYMATGDIFSGSSQQWKLNGDLTFTGSHRITTPTLIASTINNISLTTPINSATLTLANNSSLITTGGHSTTLNITGTTNITLPESGTLLTSDTAFYLGETQVTLGRSSGALTITNLNTDGYSGGLKTATGSVVVSAATAPSAGQVLTAIDGVSASWQNQSGGVISDSTGTGSKVVYSISPEITTSLTTDSTSFDLVNTTATTVNIAGAATTVSMSGSTGTTTINNDLAVSGNITYGAGATQLSATVININDPLVFLASNNSSDIMDIGIVGGYNDNGLKHTGFIRDATDKVWKLFSNASSAVDSVIDLTAVSYDDLVIGELTTTKVNKITITAPTDSATLTIADGKTLTVSNSVTFTATDASSIALGAGGTVIYTSDKLSALSSTTSAELAGVISDETGTGVLVFSETPTLVTPSVTTSITTGSTSFDLLDTVATTINFGGEATSISIGSGSPGLTTINHDLQVAGSITFSAGATSLSSTVINVDDPLIYLAANNPADIMDLGILGGYDNGVHLHTGLIRDASDKVWKLISGLSDEPDQILNTVDFTNATYDDLKIGGLLATTVNKVTITAPANSATLAIADGKAITTADSFTTSGAFPITLTATEATTVTLPASGTLVVDGYATTTTAAGTTTLTKSSASTQVFTGTTTQTIKLPSTADLHVGKCFIVTNNSTGSLAIQDSATTAIVTQAPNTTATYTVADTSTQSWVETVIPMVNSGASISLPSDKAITTADSFTTSGAFPITLTATEATTVTLPASGNLVVDGYATTATAAGTTTLTKSSASTQVFTGTTTQTIKLPSTADLHVGKCFTVTNNSTGSLAIQDSATTAIVTQSSNTTATYTVADTSTQSWVKSVIPMVNSGASLSIPSDKAITTTDSFSTSGAFPITLTATEATTVTLPASGTLDVDGYATTATAAGTTTLTKSSASTQIFTGTATETVILPSTADLYVGKRFTITNNSTGSLSVQDSATTAILTQTTKTTATYIVSDTATQGWVSWQTSTDTTGNGITSSTGSGTTVMYNESPIIKTSLVTHADSTSFDLINTVATTVNFAGAGTAISIGSNEISTNTYLKNSTVVFGNTNATASAITTPATTFNLINDTATTVNFAGEAANLNMGATNSTTTIGGSLAVTGGITVNGGVTLVNTSTVNVADPMLRMASGNTVDTVDIGILGKYNTTKFTGFVRDASDGIWKLFNELVPVDGNGQPTDPGTTLNFSQVGLGYAPIKVGALTATSFNKVSVTAPTDGATLAIANNKAITTADSFTTAGAFPITLTATASTSVTLPTSGALVADGYTTTATAAGTTALAASSTSTQVFTGTLAQTVTLPSTSGLTIGRRFTIINSSTGNLTIQDGATPTPGAVATQGSNTTATYTVAATGTQSWVHSITAKLNSGSTISIPANKSITTADSFTTSGAFPITMAATATTSVTLPDSGRLVADGYTTTATAAGTTALTATSTLTQVFTGTSTQTVTLPSTSGLTLGRRFTITNKSTGSLTIQDGATPTPVAVATQGPNTTATYTVAATGTQSWVYEIIPVLNSGAITGLKETRVAMGAATAIDLNTGNYFSKDVAASTITFTVTNTPAAGIVASFILDLTTTTGSVTYWTGVKWVGGTKPTLTASGRDVLGFFTHDGGSTWCGFVLGKDLR